MPRQSGSYGSIPSQMLTGLAHSTANDLLSLRQEMAMDGGAPDDVEDADVDVESVLMDDQSDVKILRGGRLGHSSGLPHAAGSIRETPGNGSSPGGKIMHDLHGTDDPDVDVESVDGVSDVDCLRGSSRVASPQAATFLIQHESQSRPTNRWDTERAIEGARQFTPPVRAVSIRQLSSSFSHSPKAAGSPAKSGQLSRTNDSRRNNFPGPSSHETPNQNILLSKPRRAFTSKQMFTQMLDAYHAILPALVFDPTGTENVMAEVLERKMMSAETVAITSLYLLADHLLAQTTDKVDLAVGLPTTLQWGHLPGADNIVYQQNLKILGPAFPSRVILPIVDRRASHCYLWYIVVSKRAGIYHCRFRLVDSLGQKPKEVLEERAAPIDPILNELFPGYPRECDIEQMNFPRFLQDAGSNDCGLYLCQALSAAISNQLGALRNPLGLMTVQMRLTFLLQRCAGGVLEGMIHGTAKERLQLHEFKTGARSHEVEIPGQLDDDWYETPSDKEHLDDHEVEDVNLEEDELMTELANGGGIQGGPWLLTLKAFQESSTATRYARNRYKQLLENLQLTESLVAYLSSYFWFAASRHIHPYRCLFVDPLAISLMLDQDTKAQQSGTSYQPEPSPFLWHRRELWQSMGSSCTRSLVTLTKASLSPDHPDVWFALEVSVQPDQIFQYVHVPHWADETQVTMHVRQLQRCLARRFQLPALNSQHLLLDIWDTCPESELSVEYTSSLAALYYVGTKFLPQPWTQPHFPSLHHSMLRFLKSTVQSPTPQPSLPLPNLCSQEGVFYGHKEYQDAPEWRLGSPAGSDETLSGFDFAFGRRGQAKFALQDTSIYNSFFDELRRTQPSAGSGMLNGVSGRSRQDLMGALLLEDSPTSTRNGPSASRLPQEQDPLGSLSLDEFNQMFAENGGPRSSSNRTRILQGLDINGDDLRLDWLKDSLDPCAEWFLPSTDVDSISLTTDQPELCEHLVYYPYPDRSRSISTDNNLLVNFRPGSTIAIHQCPNICFGSMAANNQFQIVVAFPHLKEQTSNRNYRNYPYAKEFQTWYEDIFLAAFQVLRRRIPNNLLALCEATLGSLPKDYLAAEQLCAQPGAPRTFLGWKISHELMNRLFPLMRDIVNRSSALAMYRDFFFHIYGINLKSIGLNVHQQGNNNPLFHVFQRYSFIPWHRQNPSNIMIDVGLDISLHPGRAPTGLTLLWRQSKLQQLAFHSWVNTTIDQYCHSDVVGGLRAKPRKTLDHGVVKMQAYLKDKLTTYISSERSLGANFTPMEGASRHSKYRGQVNALRHAWDNPRARGIRLEWRCSLWAAWIILGIEPQLWVERFLNNETIVCQPSVDVLCFKSTLLEAYDAIFEEQQKAVHSPSLLLLSSVLAYLTKSLIKRPDDMSASREMADMLMINHRAATYGLASIKPGLLDPNGYELAFLENLSSLKVLEHKKTIRPGGQRVKTSHTTGPKSSTTTRHVPVSSSTAPPLSNIGSPSTATAASWSAEDQALLEDIMQALPECLWRHFPRAFLKAPPPSNHKTLVKKPMTSRRFQRLVAEDVELRFRKRKAPGFGGVVNDLLPQGWSYETTPNTGLLARINTRILHPVRLHIKTKPDTRRDEFSRALRTRIDIALSSWEFIPVIGRRGPWQHDKHQFNVFGNPAFDAGS